MDNIQQNGEFSILEKPNGQLEVMPEHSQTSTNDASSDFSGVKSYFVSQSPEKRELLLHNEFVDVPYKLFQNEEFLRSIVNKEAFYSLSESARNHLTNNYLTPSMASNMDETLDFIFSKSPSVGFVPPLTNFYDRVQAGFYGRPHGSDCVQLRDFHKVLHNHFIRNHQMKLLKRLVQARHKILENACKQGALDEIVPKSRSAKKRSQNNEKLRKRSEKRVAMMFSKVREIVGVENTPSSDESGSEDSRIPLTMFPEAESTLYNPFYRDCELDLHQPTELLSIKSLLRKYKELREKNPECPSLDIEGITLEGVYDRVGLSYQSEKNYAQYRCKQLEKPVEIEIKNETSSSNC